MKRTAFLLLLACALLARSLSAQTKSTQLLFGGGVSVTLVNNGMALRVTTGDLGLFLISSNDYVVYYENGTTEVMSTGDVAFSAIFQDAFGGGDQIVQLNRRATALSLPTAAQKAAADKARADEARKAEAERTRQEASEKARQEAAAKAKNEVLALTASGEAAASRGESDKAIADFSKAIQTDSTFAAAYAGRGLAYYSKSDWDRAIADFTQAVRYDPKNTTVFNNRGAAYNNKSDWDRAIADLSEAIRLDPNYTNAYRHRAYAYMQKGNYTQARADVNMALKLNPNYQNAKDLDAELKKKGY